MKFLRSLRKWIRGLWSAEEKPDVPVKQLRDIDLVQVTGPGDVAEKPEFALQILARTSLENGSDPLHVMVEVLKVIPGGHNLAKWTLMTQTGVLQYRLGEFITRLEGLYVDVLKQSDQMTGVSYFNCIQNFIKEASDELMQINGLLDDMPSIKEEDEYDGSA